MKQKLGIVQALQHDPELVILDEPTEGLDPLMQEAFFGLLDEARGAGRTVFLSSHVLAEVQRACGRVAIIRAGRLVTVEAVAALRQTRARRVRLVFPESYDRAAVLAEARWSPEWSGCELRLLVPAEEVVAGLRRLLAHPVLDVAVEGAGLDEAFLAFYREEDGQTPTASAGQLRPPDPPGAEEAR